MLPIAGGRFLVCDWGLAFLLTTLVSPHCASADSTCVHLSSSLLCLPPSDSFSSFHLCVCRFLPTQWDCGLIRIWVGTAQAIHQPAKSGRSGTFAHWQLKTGTHALDSTSSSSHLSFVFSLFIISIQRCFQAFLCLFLKLQLMYLPHFLILLPPLNLLPLFSCQHPLIYARGRFFYFRTIFDSIQRIFTVQNLQTQQIGSNEI